MKRTASAKWQGTGLEGTGSLTMQSGVFNEQPYSFKTRFKNEGGSLGTNPEELLAASHAGCFNMALSFMLVGAGFTATSLDTEAVVTMDTSGENFKITNITLNLKAEVPEISKEQFLELAENAKKNCPISDALSAVEMTLNAELA